MRSAHPDENPPGATAEVYEAQRSSVSMAFRSTSTRSKCIYVRGLGVFLVHYRYLSSIGLHMYLDDLRSLSQ